jgi:N-acetylmuramoyl-L-alanine amidase
MKTSDVTATRRLVRAGLGVLFLGLCVSSAWAAPKRSSPPVVAVTAIRHWSLQEVTRIAIEVSGEFKYEWDRLSNPDRVFFDILEARQTVSKQRLHVIPVGDGLVRQIRLGQNKPRVVRVVIDLEGRHDLTVFRLSNPNRLMVEVQAARPGVEVSKAAAPAEPPPAREAAPAAPAPLPAPASEEAAQKPAAEEPPPAKPAKRNRGGGTSLTRALGLKMGKIVIDPGHGGRDTGTIGPTGLMEKDVALDVAKRLAKLVEERLGAEVVLTRTEDVSLPLEARTELANQEKADLFLSIHVNSSRYAGVSGVETFYLNLTRSQADLEVAARENAGSNKSLHQLVELVQKIALDDKIQESRDFAAHMQNALYRLARDQDPRARNRGVKKAPFVVLIGAQMPSVLVELGFISNPAEERLMRDDNYRQKMAEALYAGIAAYAATLSHFEVARTGVPD